MSAIMKIVFTALLLLSLNANAQGPGDDSDQGNLEDTETPAPIDHNVLLLGLAGLTVAFYGLNPRKKQKA